MTSPESTHAHLWYYSPDHGQLYQVIEAQTLWGETTCRVWLPGRDTVVRIPASKLKFLRGVPALPLLRK